MLFLRPQWDLLAQASGSGVTVAVAAAFPVRKYLHIEGFISGYSGSAIGRIRPGATSADTGNNCASSITEAAVNNATAVSIPGWPTGQIAITGARFFEMDIYNVSGIVKRMHGKSNNSSVAAATAPLIDLLGGIWVNTAAPIQFVDLTSYATLIATTTSQTFNSGTEFAVWGSDGI